MPVTVPTKTGNRFTLRLGTLFALILIAVLLLPLSGLYLFRIYESELVRQTENELIMQGAFMSAMYRQDFHALHGTAADGVPVTHVSPEPDGIYRPVLPELDLRSSPILSQRPDGAAPRHKPDALAERIGAKIDPLLEDARLTTLASLRLLDAHGIVVAGHGDIGLSMRGIPEVDAALTGDYSSVLRRRVSDQPYPALASISRGTDIRVFIAMPITETLNGQDHVIGVAYLSRSPRNVLKALYEEREGAFRAALFVLLVAGAVIWLLSSTIGAPLAALTRHARQLAQGEEPTGALPRPPIREIRSLTDSFEKLSEAIELRSAYIRNFAMHVAHEFKTPITAIQGAIELLHDHPEDMTPEQRLRFMDNIIRDTERLKKLVSRLLELARADVMKPASDHAAISETMAVIAQKFGAAVSFTAPEDLPAARIGADILETVIVNLAQNSLRHDARHIAVTATRHNDNITLDVQDDGTGISEANAKKLFTPFFTTARDSGGTGLGLVITRALLRAHGGDINYIPTASGALFSITLPAVLPA